MTTDDILIVLTLCAACIAWSALAIIPVEWFY